VDGPVSRDELLVRRVPKTVVVREIGPLCLDPFVGYEASYAYSGDCVAGSRLRAHTTSAAITTLSPRYSRMRSRNRRDLIQTRYSRHSAPNCQILRASSMQSHNEYTFLKVCPIGSGARWGDAARPYQAIWWQRSGTCTA